MRCSHATLIANVHGQLASSDFCDLQPDASVASWVRALEPSNSHVLVCAIVQATMVLDMMTWVTKEHRDLLNYYSFTGPSHTWAPSGSEGSGAL